MAADIGELINMVRKYDFDITVHAYQEMLNDDISIEMLVSAIAYDEARICEDYENDERGASCLVLGYNYEDVPMHFVMAYHTIRPIVITAYKNPNTDTWEEDLCTRRANRVV